MAKRKKKLKRPDFNRLAKDFTAADTTGRELNIAQTKECIKYIRWCFQQDPVGMFRLFTKGM